jgi:radical SAM protein with 4Fe4S-binding SPASM domain
MGNWKQNSLGEIWNGEKMKKLREMHRKGEYDKNPACKSCIANSSYMSD